MNNQYIVGKHEKATFNSCDFWHMSLANLQRGEVPPPHRLSLYSFHTENVAVIRWFSPHLWCYTSLKACNCFCSSQLFLPKMRCSSSWARISGRPSRTLLCPWRSPETGTSSDVHLVGPLYTTCLIGWPSLYSFL